MSCESKQEYIEVQRRRYCRVAKAYKTRLLDEVCEVCGYDRKYAIKLLGRSKQPSKKKRGRKSEYDDPELTKALKRLWLKSGQMCSKRLKQALPLWLNHYKKHHGDLAVGCRKKLLQISQASIDRLLKPYKAQQRRKCNTGTKPGTLLKNQIPIRTSNEDIDRPGYLEADTVAHCGGSMSGEFIWSVTYTDIKTGWTALRAVWNKGYEGVRNQTQDVELSLPFKIPGFDCDNESEFLNHHLTRYFLHREQPVHFTRSRPYRKNDNAHVEQKNWPHVRELLGYDRLDNPAMLKELNRLYQEWEQLNNFFKPSLKLKSKMRQKSRYIKTYDTPAPPFQRLKASGILSDKQEKVLQEQYESLDPFELEQRIQRRLKKIEKMKPAAGSPQSGAPGLPTASRSLTPLQPTGT
ncbi:integrase [Tichowtungia aerotolerans]|uniref:integrase n=1 Tax=Tichowtungia aerotolerans TaxID=2697043 RepID=UPI001E2B83A4|nr:integrase [Tichowtungia aerotolerans]